MNGTFLKQSQSTYAAFTLSDFQIRLDKGSQDLKDFNGEDVKQLVCYSPSSQKLFGATDFNKTYHINNSNTNYFIGDLLSELNISKNNAVFFSSHSPGKANKQEAKLPSSKKNFIYLKVESSIMASLYETIRNSLAHADFIRIDNNVYFFSFVRADLEEKDIEKRRLSFLLCLKGSAKKLSAYHRMLEQYKQAGLHKNSL